VLPVRKAVLAAHLGTVAEPLSRSLRRLKDAGIIREHKSAIHVLDADRLAELHEMGAAALDQG
jgi:CRP-like cAMP-binding protein